MQDSVRPFIEWKVIYAFASFFCVGSFSCQLSVMSDAAITASSVAMIASSISVTIFVAFFSFGFHSVE